MADTATTKKTVAVALPRTVFDVNVDNHELVKRAYESYLSKGRQNSAVTKTRGLVRGGGKKPWQQKGTGRARAGSSRSPIWRSGGVTFGPTGLENYVKSLSTAEKRHAVRQALTFANKASKIIVIPTFAATDGKVKNTTDLIAKHKLERKVLLVVDMKDPMVDRATRNVSNVKTVQATYLNVYDVMNADHIVITKKSIDLITAWLVKTEGAKNA
ncbi:50S ribosomal protein L4 [Candidatus Saccharibacteria bacterium]|jgi:large subunit ribosomal protein L4|nr:50S ribosomal protein L4 [Candidatus Saccharibacteria bacterium]